MTRRPKISVIVPVKNGERYLSDALQSVLKQTFADFELLVVDDGSTDSSADIISAIQKRDTRVKVLSNPGYGLVDALNFGVASACAPLIARMDADDICLPERFQRQYDFLAARPEVAVVGTQVIFVDERGVPKAKSPNLPQAPDAIARLLLKGCCIRHPTVLFRREAFKRQAATGMNSSMPRITTSGCASRNTRRWRTCLSSSSIIGSIRGRCRRRSSGRSVFRAISRYMPR